MPSNQNGQNSQQGSQGKSTLSWSQPASKAALPVVSKPATPQVVTAVSKSSQMGTYVGIFVAGIIVGVLIGWGITSIKGKGGTVATTATNKATSTASTKPITTNTNGVAAGVSIVTEGQSTGLTVANQKAGLEVAVSGVTVAKATWVVIYANNNGVPGNAIGAHLFFPTSQGGSTSGTVELLRATMPGQSYFAGESLDDGDHKFSMTNDKPVRDSKGNPLWVEFKVQ